MKKSEIAKETLEKVNERLESASILLNEGQYFDSVSRSYYAILDMVRGMLEIESELAKTQKGSITKFNEIFIKTGKIDKEYGKVISEIQKSREEADYSLFTEVSKTDAEEANRKANEFIEVAKKEIESYL